MCTTVWFPTAFRPCINVFSTLFVHSGFERAANVYISTRTTHLFFQKYPRHNRSASSHPLIWQPYNISTISTVLRQPSVNNSKIDKQTLVEIRQSGKQSSGEIKRSEKLLISEGRTRLAANAGNVYSGFLD